MIFRTIYHKFSVKQSRPFRSYGHRTNRYRTWRYLRNVLGALLHVCGRKKKADRIQQERYILTHRTVANKMKPSDKKVHYRNDFNLRKCNILRMLPFLPTSFLGPLSSGKILSTVMVHSYWTKQLYRFRQTPLIPLITSSISFPTLPLSLVSHSFWLTSASPHTQMDTNRLTEKYFLWSKQKQK